MVVSVIIAIIVGLALVLGIGGWMVLRRMQQMRVEQLNFLRDMEAEVLAAEETGPVLIQPRSPDNEGPAGLALGFLEHAALDESNPGRMPQTSGLLMDDLMRYIDQPLAWVIKFSHLDQGERYDLRPLNGGPLLAVLERRYGGLFRLPRVVAQVGSRYYALGEDIFGKLEIRDPFSGALIAYLPMFGFDVHFANGQNYHWEINNPLEKPCAFISSNGTEMITYSGSIGNIRIKSTNIEVVAALMLLLVYEYHRYRGK